MMKDEEFRQLVEYSFAFLEHELGFAQPQLVRDGPTEDGVSRYVRMVYSDESGNHVELGTASWRSEFDVKVALGTFPEYERWASLRELLAVIKPDYLHPLPVSLGTASSDPRRMREHVAVCAQSLRKFGDRFFDHDEDLWSELETYQQQQREAVLEEIEMENARRANDRAREDAIAAFQRADWAYVVELYEAMSEPLTSSEQRRLTISQDRLAEEKSL